MRQTVSAFFIFFSAVFVFPVAWASPFLAYDARTMAMGGAGVALGDSANAALVNPALLGLQSHSDRFSLELPAATILLSDRGNIRGAWADYDANRYDEKVTKSVNAFNDELTLQKNTATYDINALYVLRDEVVYRSRLMLDALQRFSDHWLGLQGNIAAVVGVPDPGYGASLFWNTWTVGGAIIEITPQDTRILNKLLNDAASITLTNYDDILVALSLTDPKDKLYSNFQGRASVVTEFGFALARQVHWFDGDVSIGLSPKILNIKMYDFKYVVRDAKPFMWNPPAWQNEATGINVDLGLSTRLKEHFVVGLVAKNVVPQTYDTQLGNKFYMHPQWRVGGAYAREAWMFTSDIDLAENAPATLESKSQFIGLGAEWRAFYWLRPRGGFRYDVATRGKLLTAGLGISVWALHMDVAIVGNRNELGGSLQLGVRF